MASLPAPDSLAPPAPPKRPWLRPLLATVGYGGIIYLAWRAIDHQRFAEGVARLRLTDILLVLGISMMHITGRALRYHRLLLRNNPRDYRWLDGFVIFLVGLSTSAVTPARAGDFVKAQLVRKHGVSGSAGVGLVLIERMLDLLVLTGTILVAGFAMSEGASAAWSRAAFVLLIGLVLGLVAITTKRIRNPVLAIAVRIVRRLSKKAGAGIASKLETVFDTWDIVFTSPATFGAYLAGSAVVWALEFGKLWCVLTLLGTHTSLATIFFVYPVSILAGVLSVLPFSEGVVGVTGVALLSSLAGVDPAVATVAVVLDRGASSLPPIALAAVAAVVRRTRGGSP